jgi:putative PIN family toxin of toxin-antitoxin system
MLNVVVDTNIVISAAISSLGNPAKIMDLVFDEKIQAYYSPPIFAEYKKVLARKRLNIAPDVQSDIIEAIKQAGISIEPAASNISMPDESDRVHIHIIDVVGTH